MNHRNRVSKTLFSTGRAEGGRDALLKQFCKSNRFTSDKSLSLAVIVDVDNTKIL
jgi:hypothetical protein